MVSAVRANPEDNRPQRGIAQPSKISCPFPSPILLTLEKRLTGSFSQRCTMDAPMIAFLAKAGLAILLFSVYRLTLGWTEHEIPCDYLRQKRCLSEQDYRAELG